MSKSVTIARQIKSKNGKLPTKIAITTPWEALCVDLVGPYTLKGKDGTQIDFMCLTMIDPATSWFEIVELPVLETLNTLTDVSKKGTKAYTKQPKEAYFDKSSAIISTLVNKTWFSRYPCCQHIIWQWKQIQTSL